MYQTPEAFLRATLASGLQARLEQMESPEYRRQVFDYRSRLMLAQKTNLRDGLAAQLAGVKRRIAELDQEIKDIEKTRELYFEVMGR